MTALLVRIVKAAGLPAPEPEHRFAPPRRWRFDYAWIPQKVALEVDGGVWTNGRHTRGAGFLRDVEKLNEAALLGWRVLRCTPDEAASGKVLDLLKRALA